jgi:hypothetical protein
MEDFLISYIIPLAYIALGIAALGAIAFPLIQMFSDLKKAVTTFVAIGIVIVIFLVCYALSANEPFTIHDKTVSAGQMRFIEAAIYMFYLLLVGSGLAILYSSVSRYFK